MNEFTTKTKSGGTRGGSPGDYVKRYILRDYAVEELSPIKYRASDSYDTIYDNREIAADNNVSRKDIKKDMKRVQRMAGVAFGNEGPSFSHKQVLEKSNVIQKAFDDGKTVLKTVLSFDTRYLKDMGIIPEEEEYDPVEGWSNKVDQMKLRLAIMNGMKRMSSGFDDLQWIASIQIDARHVHCHIAAVDMGEGRIRYDGSQRGMLTSKDITALRRTVDMSLNEMHPVKFLASDISKSRRNVRCLVKARMHELMRDYGVPQFLIACLPKDKREWRAASNAENMKKANEITREFVENVYKSDKTLYNQTRRQLSDYALTRQKNEDLTQQETRILIENGERRIVEDAMNGIYQMLKEIPEDEYRVETPMIDIMSMNKDDMASLASYDSFVEFGFRLRSYSSRLRYHKEKRNLAEEQVRRWEDEAHDEASYPVYEFYKLESQYHDMCMAKYQHFLNFIPRGKKWEEELNDYVSYAQKCEDLTSMLDDKSPLRMSADAAEDYCWRVYRQRGGRFLKNNPSIIESRLDSMLEELAKRKSRLQFDMAEDGISFDVINEVDEEAPGFDRRHVDVRRFKNIAHEFDDVKALDMHSLSWDFPYDVDVSYYNYQAFSEMAQRRYDALNDAKEYLIRSNQLEVVDTLDEDNDISRMHTYALKMEEEPVVRSLRKEAANKNRVKTTPLDLNLVDDMKFVVESTLRSAELDSTL